MFGLILSLALWLTPATFDDCYMRLNEEPNGFGGDGQVTGEMDTGVDGCCGESSLTWSVENGGNERDFRVALETSCYGSAPSTSYFGPYTVDPGETLFGHYDLRSFGDNCGCEFKYTLQIQLFGVWVDYEDTDGPATMEWKCQDECP
ncbi:MAG: hypothetical protein OEM32_04545 [Acidimicrobiia bacterium]|nr:hypothetical protein [Acidimicrobiia bacterium]